MSCVAFYGLFFVCAAIVSPFVFVHATMGRGRGYQETDFRGGSPISSEKIKKALLNRKRACNINENVLSYRKRSKEAEEMEIRELVNYCLESRDMTKTQLAKRAGYASPQNLTNKLARPSGMRIDSLIEIMDAMGYDVVIKDRMNEKEIVLTLQEEKK